MTTIDGTTETAVAIGGPRGGPPRVILREDRLWVQPPVPVATLTALAV